MWQPQGFYNQYVLRTPVILSGDESVRGLYNYPAARIAVIHGKSFADRDLFLSTFSKRDIHFISRSWKDEPDIEGLKETIRQLEEYQPDTIIAVGGGSVIDGGKLCRLFYEFPYYRIGETRISGESWNTHFVAVPTTTGSGSEVSSAAVFVDHDRHRKDMVVMHELQPEAVVYDKRYVLKTPERLLAASALDAMAHILEGYVSKTDNAFLDVLAEKGLSILHDELQKLTDNKDEAIDYERLQYAGYIGGLIQNHCIVGAAHAVAHQLTDNGYSHGEAVALLLPSVISLNADVITKYEKISHEAGFRDKDELMAFIQKVCQVSGIADRREELGELLCGLLNDNIFYENVKNDRGGKGNPVTITDEFIRQLAESV